MRIYILTILLMGFYSGQNFTVDDGTESVESWGESYSIGETTDLNLNANQLTGSIPSETGNLINLTDILIKPLIYTIHFYQDYLGKIKGSYCPMYPSCSEYGRIAISKYNFKGILMTIDRLNRCSHDLENYNLISFEGKLRYQDEPY